MTGFPDEASPARRRFLMLMGLACAACVVPSTADALGRPLRPARPSPAPPPPSADLKPPSAEARALTEVVRLRYGSQLSIAKLGIIAADLDGRLESGRALRGLKLESGDEPETIFHA